MIVVPAIDLKDGRCVRLYEGRLGSERVVAKDAVDQARRFEALGAERLHVVDLDGAFAGAPKNRELIEEIVRAVSIPVQVGGGLRTEEAVRGALETGVRFAILGTLAVDDPASFEAICQAHPGAIIAGVDARGEKAATNGWVNESKRSVIDVAESAAAAGAAAVITTDITRDGTGKGVNVERTERLASATSIPVFASGGVAGLADIEALARTSVYGVIVGRALYDGALDLSEAIRAASGA